MRNEEELIEALKKARAVTDDLYVACEKMAAWAKLLKDAPKYAIRTVEYRDGTVEEIGNK